MSGLRVIAAASFPRHGASTLHDLARAVRAGDPGAVDRGAGIAATGLAREAPELDRTGGVILVPMASHEPGPPSRSASAIGEALALRHPDWLVSPALERIAPAPRAMDAPSRDAAAEAATLRWTPVHGEGPVLIVDDVVHTGASLQAAWLAAPPELQARLVALVAFRAE